MNNIYRPKRIHYQTEIKLDISKDISKEAPKLIADILVNVWPDTYLADLDYKDYIDIVTDLWMLYYIQSDKTKEAITKIIQSKPPSDLKIYLVFNLFDKDDNLIIDYSEMATEPLFRAYLPTKDLWDTYLYSKNKFESLEIIEPAYIEEIKQSMTKIEKSKLDDLLVEAYSFHNRLLAVSSKKILLYTAQQQKIIDDWNKKRIIPKNTYFTDKISRAEYYFVEGDIIVEYRVPTDKIVMTSDFGGAKEYVTIDNIPIK